MSFTVSADSGFSVSQCERSCQRKWGIGAGANRRCDCDGYRPDTLAIDIGSLDWYTWSMNFRLLRIAVPLLFTLLWVGGVSAVECASINYNLQSQADVDALGSAGCDTVRDIS